MFKAYEKGLKQIAKLAKEGQPVFLEDEGVSAKLFNPKSYSGKGEKTKVGFDKKDNKGRFS